MNNSNYSPLISVCIPTYNRGNKVFQLVTNILKYPGEDIEVVVVDNRSTDNTLDLLNNIKDGRFKLIENEANIGGPMNQLKALTLAEGTFAFFCLDKDWLDSSCITNLIKVLKNDKDCLFGYCGLNLTKVGPNQDYKKGLDSLLNMAYLSQHPTGIFYHKETYKNLPILHKILTEKKPFPFYPDLVNGQMALLGNSKFINIPAFYTELKDDCKDVLSFTYDEKNIFFSPNNRLIEFNTYVAYASQLGLSKNELNQLISRLYRSCLQSVTFGYKYIMSDEHVCSHYSMKTREVGLAELLKLHLFFVSNFKKQHLAISSYLKAALVVSGLAKFTAKGLLGKY